MTSRSACALEGARGKETSSVNLTDDPHPALGRLEVFLQVVHVELIGESYSHSRRSLCYRTQG
jgi:hypothetical protein